MKNLDRIYVDFHVIQTVPPSCVNRDDTGSPKTALYGGVRRARVSSQSWKRAMREMFCEDLDKKDIGIRTKRIVNLLAEELLKLKMNMQLQDAQIMAEKIMNALGLLAKKKKGEVGKTKALFFISRTQAHNLATYILANQNATDKDIKKMAKTLLNQDNSIDIALFGRMVAASDDLNLNVEASAQVAHSISTHRVDNEYDYFTAIDDLAPEDKPGAGMIGVVEYNSSTMYRYATVAAHNLFKELGGEKEATAAAVGEFAKAFIQSMPTGKQNTFANRTLPDAVLVTIRRDQPINLVGAFEEPVRTVEGGYVKPSIQRLEKYAEQVYDQYVDAPEKAWAIGMEGQEETVNMKELLQGLQDTLLHDMESLEKE